MHRYLFACIVAVVVTAGAFLISCEKQTPGPTQSVNQPMFAITEAADPAIAFSEDTAATTKKSTTTTYYLVVMNADGSNRTKIYTSTTNYPLSPNWSPDGKHLAYFLKGGAIDLYTCDVAVVNGVPQMQNAASLVGSINPGVGTGKAGNAGIAPAWDPDISVSEIAFVNSSNIQVVSSAGGAPSTIYNATPAGFDIAAGPSYSPDGKLLAFDIENPNGNGDTIEVIDRATGTVKQSFDITSLVGLSEFGSIQWGHASGDTKIAFGFWTGTTGYLYSVDYAQPASAPVKIYSSASLNDHGCSTWSPDDSKLLFMGDSPFSKNGNAFTFNTVAVSGGAVARIDTVTASGHAAAFDWRRF